MDEPRGAIRLEPSGKRVRCYLGGELVADTVAPVLVWEHPKYPAYYLPRADVRAELVPSGPGDDSPSRGKAELLDVVVPGTSAHRAARHYPDSPVEALRSLVRFEWSAMDEWLEEDEPVYVHPRSPYTRIDCLASSRHVEVAVDGVTVADSRRPVVLFETGLPPRFYLPLPDVRLDLLRPSDSHTSCPYKGTASYWSLEVNGRRYEDIVWTYRMPIPECQKIAGMACFYNERVDLRLDGRLQERPRTPFS